MLALAIISTVILGLFILGLFYGNMDDESSSGVKVIAWMIISTLALVIITVWILYLN